MTYEQLESRLVAWAQTQPDIRAIFVIGSRARGSADSWSDLDLLIFTGDPDRYGDDPGWLHTFGEVWVTYMEPTGLGDPEWYAVYEGGLKIDAVLMRVEDMTRDLESLIAPFDDWDAFRRGTSVIYDSLGEPRALEPKPPKPRQPPTAEHFTNVVNGLLMAALTTAKFTARGDFWRAQRWFANDLHPHLLTLAEWHAYGKDTWYGGRFMEQWADKRIVDALPSVFPGFDRDSLKASLLAYLNLVGWLGDETAAKFGFAYPMPTHEKIAALVRAILAD